MRHRYHIPIMALVFLWAVVSPGSSQSAQPEGKTMRPTGTLSLPGGGGYIDYLTLSPGTHTLYAAYASRDEIVAVDTETNHVKTSVKGLRDVRGMALVPDRGLGFTSNRGADTAGIVNLSTNRLTGTVPAGHGPDAVLYNEAARLVYVADHEGKTATLIDPATQKAVGTVSLGGAAEYAQADPRTGLVYQNLEDTSEVVVVDPGKRSVVKRFKLSSCKGPTGLAYDEASRRLFCACGNQKLSVLDADSGKEVAILPIGAGVDFAAYDAGLHRIYTANGKSGSITVIGQDGPDRYRVLENVKTFSGGHALTVDPASHRVYLAHGSRIAVYDALPPG